MTAETLILKVNINPREVISVPPGILGKFGDPIPDWALPAVGLSMPNQG